MNPRVNHRVSVSPAIGAAVLSLCGSVGLACYDIMHSNWAVQGEIEAGTPCTWCPKIAWDSIVPGAGCLALVSLIEGTTRVCYSGVVVINQFGLPSCQYNIQYPTTVHYHPIVCQIPCFRPAPR